MVKHTTFRDLQYEVRAKLPAKVLKSMKNSLSFKEKELWATKRCNQFNYVCLLVTLLKDLNGWSFNKLLDYLEGLQHFAKKSLEHNVQVIRRKLRQWSETVLVTPPSATLIRMAKRLNRPKSCENVYIWMDSTECRLTGKNSMSRKHPDWSYKCNSPGTKWNVVMDASSRAIFVTGPHSPSLYDGDLTIASKQELEQTFRGATVVADCHYSKCSNFFDKITFVTPYTAAGRPKIIQGKKVPYRLPPEKLKHNGEVAGVRGKVEAPFGWINNKFTALEKPFGEGREQHDCLFRYALACHYIVVSK